MVSEIIPMALASAVRQEKAMRRSKTGEEKMTGLLFADDIHWIQRICRYNYLIYKIIALDFWKSNWIGLER